MTIQKGNKWEHTTDDTVATSSIHALKAYRPIDAILWQTKIRLTSLALSRTVKLNIETEKFRTLIGSSGSSHIHLAYQLMQDSSSLYDWPLFLLVDVPSTKLQDTNECGRCGGHPSVLCSLVLPFFLGGWREEGWKDMVTSWCSSYGKTWWLLGVAAIPEWPGVASFFSRKILYTVPYLKNGNKKHTSLDDETLFFFQLCLDFGGMAWLWLHRLWGKGVLHHFHVLHPPGHCMAPPSPTHRPAWDEPHKMLDSEVILALNNVGKAIGAQRWGWPPRRMGESGGVPFQYHIIL